MKKTKIICSIGPATQTWDRFKDLVLAGMNVARINFSHATEEERMLDEDLVKRANEELGANIAILYDTKGPDLRTCSFENDKIELVAGQTIRIVEEDVVGNSERISLNYKGITQGLKVGTKILVDDGFYKLTVVSKEEDGVTCEILNSGTIKSRRGVCIPGIKLEVPYISEKDEEDIRYACEHDGDYLAISFVNSKEDIRQVKDLCAKYGKPNMPIISKVETQYAMDNLQEIVEESDYIMIARGDLGIETGVENLPLYQQMMIDACHANGKGVIMATQMMYSMKTNIRPTNAEVTDVANAVLAGCDAIMTSDETTIGNYPIETVQTMTSICENAERITKYNLSDYKLKGTEIHNTIAECAVKSTTCLPIKAVVVSTLTGKTALDISSLRPNSFIVAAVTDPKVARSLALKWGVYTKLVPVYDNTDSIINDGIKAAKEVMNLQPGDIVTVVGGFPKEAHTNFMKIEII
ncbi:MAG: pyruvate kinase [Firmicutes bacterium]|nr:pyruvate kinase [Bacillota bacterium]